MFANSSGDVNSMLHMPQLNSAVLLSIDSFIINVASMRGQDSSQIGVQVEA